MRRKIDKLIAGSVLLLFLTVPALSEKSKTPVASDPQKSEPTVQVDKSKPGIVPTTPGQVESKAGPRSVAPNYFLDWFSINGGGDSYGTSTNYQLGYSVGQPVAGEGNSASYDLGIGFWYGAYTLCTSIPGD